MSCTEEQWKELKANEAEGMKEHLKLYKIRNTSTGKYVKQENGALVVMQYPEQARAYIERRLNCSPLFEIVEFKRGGFYEKEAKLS